MIKKTKFIAELAKDLESRKETKTGQQLVDILNTKGFRTSYNTEYSGGRGIYRLLDAVYNRLKEESGEGEGTDAHNVAVSFTDATGDYAWRFKPENQ